MNWLIILPAVWLVGVVVAAVTFPPIMRAMFDVDGDSYPEDSPALDGFVAIVWPVFVLILGALLGIRALGEGGKFGRKLLRRKQ